MSQHRSTALLLCTLMLSSGCLGLFENDSDQIEEVDCQNQPTHSDCFVHVITPEDCTIQQIFTGDSCRPMQVPSQLSYGTGSTIMFVGVEIQALTPSFQGDGPQSWSVNPPLPEGLELDESGVISGVPLVEAEAVPHTITGTNAMGSATVILDIVIRAPMPESIRYPIDTLTCTLDSNCEIGPPILIGGPVQAWAVEPTLPGEMEISENGSISGIVRVLGHYNLTIWANNSGGSASTNIQLSITSLPPDGISWPSGQFALRSNQSAHIPVTNYGPDIETWEILPELPMGLTLHSEGISGTPTERTDWIQYTIWANNSGGSSEQILWIAIHDLRADQSDLLKGIGETNWGGWPSPILPVGEFAFPIGFAEGGYGSKIPVISASHVGRGKILGYGHESWVDGHGEEETEFSLRAVEWACGANADVGLAYGAGFDDFKDELQEEGHTVHLSVAPGDLSGLDCLLDEFWNGHDDQDNQNLVDFMLDGGGLIMGGHAWYWSYSNTDLAHNYPGNKIAKTSGLFVSDAWGYNNVDLSDMPHELSTPNEAIKAIRGDRIDNLTLSMEDATVVDETLSVCTGVVTLDFNEFWSPLRETVNATGWSVIEYGTLWQDVGHNMGEDPVADTLLRVEAALTQNLPADELPAHPSHVEFPGEVPANATRISRIVTIDGNQSGLPSNFGYSQARSHVRMTTGLYAAPGEVVTVTLPSEAVDSDIYVLVGAHSDNLWEKSQLHRHPEIVRWWNVDQHHMEVGNAFGGPIYIAVSPGSTLGVFQVTISNAVKAPTYIHGHTDVLQWLQEYRHDPAPWAEIGSDQFILTVPSNEIRDLDDPDDLMDWWDEALGMEHELYGFLPWPRVERAVFDTQISAGWMHSGYPFMAHDLSVPGVVNVSYMAENGDWGMFHELGHNHQWMPSTLPGTTESSCNFASVYLMEELVGIEGHGAISPDQRSSRMRSYFEDGSNISNWSVWVALDTYLIIKEEWGWEPITEALSVYYNLPNDEVPEGDIEEFNEWVVRISNSTGYNLAPYHEAWGFPLTQATFDALEYLPVWVDDPLRGEYFSYSAILRNISSTDPSDATSSTISWQTYDNGTDTTLMFYYGRTDMGNQTSGWEGSNSFGSTNVGNHSQTISGLTCCGTDYYGRIKASNAEETVWFGPINWTTDYLLD
ncbi:MAG: hypothetical protein CMA62_03450 [Euryarchaeota archaeon]|nr:hypothetical protein [Euryarchaeota archaeon]